VAAINRHSAIRVTMAVRKPIAAPDAISLPSLFRLITLREAGDAFRHAIELPDKTAGTLVWARRFQLAEFALVLEPSEPLAEARLAIYAAMNALADTLAIHCPPEKPVAFAWPDTLLLDGGILGGGRTAWNAECGEDEPPDWLVFGAMVRTAGHYRTEPGLWKRGVALAEEGMWDLRPADIVEGFARHLMSALHNWSEFGPRHEVARWMARLHKRDGALVGLDDRGNLREIVGGKTQEAKSLAEALKTPAWLDPETGEPWL
jgi:biotin-(acetyl-CoA carboxylase) ligase